MVSNAFSTRVVILRIRSSMHILVVTLGIIWISLLALETYLRGDYHSTQESAAVTTLIAVNCVSTIGIPVFAILDFSEKSEDSRWYTHIRFELAFICTQFVLQTTAAFLFTILSPNFSCENSDTNADAEGECRLLNVYISIASWIIPLILFSFIIYFVAVCFRAARRFPALWRTAVRFCPWEDRPVASGLSMVEENRNGSIQTRDLENGSRATISTITSTQPSRFSRESSQSTTLLINPRNSSSQRTSQPVHPRATPGRVPLRAVSQLPPSRVIWPPPPSRFPSRPPAYRPMSQPPPPRGTSQIPPNRTRFNNVSGARSSPHITLSKVPSRPLPLRPAIPRLQSPSMLVANAYGPSPGPVRSSTPHALKKSGTLDYYVEEWKRERRDLTMHPTWLGGR